jgi:hypothetical protein
MKGLIRSHVHFNNVGHKLQPCTWHPVYIMCVSFHAPYALNSPASTSTRLQFVLSCALYQSPLYGTSSPFGITIQPTSNPNYMLRSPNISTGINPEQPVIRTGVWNR